MVFSAALASRGSRARRARRVETAILVLLVATGLFSLRAIWPRVTGIVWPGTLAALAAGKSPANSAGSALVAAPMAAPKSPPIAFSFAKFEADAALVAGAASTGVPSVSGDSAIVVDVNTKEVIYAKQPHKRQLMASTAKIMTAIVAVEHGVLDKVLTVPEEATKAEPNHMGIKTGEKLTLQELLYGLMLDSGNDAAEAIAFGVGGGGTAGRAQFVRWMNEKVTELGLRNTRFVNPSGLDDPEQYSTAYDLAIMGAYALGKPELRKTFGTKDIVISPSKEPGREHGWFNPGNLNSLLATYRGAVGIKPGYTEDAGYTLVAAAERDGRTLVAVTLQSRKHFSDCSQLLDFGFGRPA